MFVIKEDGTEKQTDSSDYISGYVMRLVEFMMQMSSTPDSP